MARKGFGYLEADTVEPLLRHLTPVQRVARNSVRSASHRFWQGIESRHRL